MPAHPERRNDGSRDPIHDNLFTMNYLMQIFFLLCLVAAGYFLYRRINFILRNISLGKPETGND